MRRSLKQAHAWELEVHSDLKTVLELLTVEREKEVVELKRRIALVEAGSGESIGIAGLSLDSRRAEPVVAAVTDRPLDDTPTITDDPAATGATVRCRYCTWVHV